MRKDKKEKGEVSRRDFLIGAGSVIVGGAIGAGITYPLLAGKEVPGVTTTKTVEITKTVTAPGPTITSTVGATTVTVPTTVTTTVGATTVTSTVPGPTTTKTVTVGDGVIPPYLEPEKTTFKHCTPGLAAFDIKNGKVVRGRPPHFDLHYPALKPWTMTARGKTLTLPLSSMPAPPAFLYRKRADSPCKALYPLKRVDWEPGGDPAKMNTQNRGKSKYKRISWDEAATLVASELKRVADKYGIEAVSQNSSSMGENKNIVGSKGIEGTLLKWWGLKKYGGYPTSVVSATASFVGGAWGGIHFWGTQLANDDGYEQGDLIQDVAEHTELLVVWPGDTTSKLYGKNFGLSMARIQRFYKDLGIRMVYLDSRLSMGPGVFNDKWIPVYPNNDCAMHLAIAYTWIKEDTYDKDYIKTHTVGFDKWKAYVMGDEDGIPKTPAWASPFCGVPEWTIKALAREWASHVTSLCHARQGGGLCRAPYSTEPARMGPYLVGMQGAGKPGVHQLRTGFTGGPAFGYEKTASVNNKTASKQISAAMSSEFTAAQISAAANAAQKIPQRELAKAILNPPCEWWDRRTQHIKEKYPLPGKSEVHLIWCSGASWLGGCVEGNAKFRAFRSPKIECYINSTQFMEESPYYADIILPIATQMEVDDIKTNSTTAHCLYIERGIKPRGECKTDYGAVLEVAKKLGLYDKAKLLEGYDTVEEFYQAVIKNNYEKSGFKDLISWEKLNEIGYFALQAKPGNVGMETPMNNFYKDPAKNPVGSPTGKLEFESTYLKEWYPNDNERPPVAHFVRGGPPEEGWTHDEDRLISRKAKEYPLLMISDTPYWGEHSMHSDIPWTREISKKVCWDGYAYENIWVHPETAAARGIKYGDIVKVINDRGAIMGAAHVTEQIKPGVLHCTKARQCDYIIPFDLNRAGSPNSIAPAVVSRHVRLSSPYNGYLVQLEKVTGEQMDNWRKNYPEAFARDHDPAYGPLTSGWIIEGGK